MSALALRLSAAAAFVMLAACGDVETFLDRSASAEPAEAETVTAADRLAGHWTCANVGGPDLPAGAVIETKITIMRDGKATEMAVVRTREDGHDVEVHSLARSKWELKGEAIHWRYEFAHATRYLIDGKEVDVGLVNSTASDKFRADPEKLRNVSKLTLFKGDLLDSTETDGSTTKCVRRKG